MIRSVSRQVIVVGGGNNDFFEEAIFVLKDTCVKNGIKEKDLLRQAKSALTDPIANRRLSRNLLGVFCACGGFAIGSCIWVLILLF